MNYVGSITLHYDVCFIRGRVYGRKRRNARAYQGKTPGVIGPPGERKKAKKKAFAKKLITQGRL